MSTISTEDLLSYGMWAEFLHGLQNFRYPQVSVGGSGFARNGVDYTINDINNILAGSYSGAYTRPLLNKGIGSGMPTMPLGIFKDSVTDASVVGVGGYLATFKDLLVDTVKDVPEGAVESGNYWLLSDGAVKMYTQGYPYISVNPLRKSGQWINLNSQPNPPTQYSISGVEDALDQKGAQYSLFSTGKANADNLKFENATLDPSRGNAAPIKSNNPRTAGASTRFRYIPGSGQKLEITYEFTDELTTQQTQGTRQKNSESISNTFKISENFKENISVEVPEVGKAGAETSTTIENALQTSFASESEITASTSKTTKETSKRSIKYTFDPGALKEGSPITELGTLTGEVNLKDPNQRLISGSEYIASFVFDSTSIALPTNGLQNISGTPGLIKPRSMQYQAIGRDEGIVNWFENFDTTPDGRFTGKSASYFAEKFKNFAGLKAYNINEKYSYTAPDGSVKTIDSFEFNDDGSFRSLAVVDTSTSTSFDVFLDISKYHSSSSGQNSNAFESSLDSSVYDLQKNGQENMSEFYEGSDSTDHVLGSAEGDDYVHTGDGNDIVKGMYNSHVETGDGDDDIQMSTVHSDNFIDAGTGNDKLKIDSKNNVIELGTGADNITAKMGNAIYLGKDSDADVVTLDSTESANTYLLEFDLGNDQLNGLKQLDFRYDHTYQRLLGYESNAEPLVTINLHSEEDLDLRDSGHRLFLMILSKQDPSSSDRTFVETGDLSDQQMSDFIQKFVFTPKSSSNSLQNNPNAFSPAAILDSLLENPTIKSLGQAAFQSASGLAETAFKSFFVDQLVRLGVPSFLASGVVDASWNLISSALDTTSNSMAFDSPSDNDLEGIANTFLTGLVSGIEHHFHTIAFPSDLIDSLTGLATTPSPDNDAINGTDLNDWLRAGAGNDLINAGVGNDAVRAGTGSDQITLGAGSDALVISYDQLDGATDTVTDFNSTEDRLLIEDLIQVEQITPSQLRLFTTGTSGEEERELTVVFGGGMNYVLDELPIERFSFV